MFKRSMACSRGNRSISGIECFWGNTSGQISVLFAIAAVPVLLAGGVAIDRIRIDNARTSMQAALDGAALAAANANTQSNDRREELAEAYFERNFVGAGDPSANFSINVTKAKVTATASYDVATPFMALGGFYSATVTTEGEVLREGETFVELAMVLDYSGSMNSNNKYLRMAKAATEMVDGLETSIGKDRLKIGLVPFSAMVAASMPAQYVTQPSPSETWTGCTQDRRSPYNITVGTPNPADDLTKWGYFDAGENSGAYACPTYLSKQLEILPLTDDLDAVRAKLSAMRPLGNTNIPLGTEFGWNLLDKQQPFIEAMPYGNKTYKKYLLLLTDGVQTSSQWGPGGIRSVASGNKNLTSLCAGIKASGITVFTIAYDVNDPAVTKLLKTCAGSNYYQPDVSASGIAEVFAAITKEINRQTVRLSR
jgi:Flp pilus assembly protein TadG